jgi:hypothetical protein
VKTVTACDSFNLRSRAGRDGGLLGIDKSRRLGFDTNRLTLDQAVCLQSLSDRIGVLLREGFQDLRAVEKLWLMVL